MNISEKIYALRTKSGITQEAFAEKLDVSRQSVQKWETGVNLPTIDKLIAIAKMFNVSMDYFCDRADAELFAGRTDKEYVPDYGKMSSWESYAKSLDVEYRQLLDEGKDVANLKDVFLAVEKMPLSKYKDDIADTLFKLVDSLPITKRIIRKWKKFPERTIRKTREKPNKKSEEKRKTN